MLIGSCQPNICRMPTEVVRLSRAFGLTQVRDWRQSTHAAVRTRLDKTIVGGVNVRARVQVELNLEATKSASDSTAAMPSSASMAWLYLNVVRVFVSPEHFCTGFEANLADYRWYSSNQP